MTATLFRRDGNGLALVGEAESLLLTAKGLPDGAYTTLRTYGAVGVVRLSKHLARLNESLALLGRRAHLEEGEARHAIKLALAKTGFGESRLRLTWAPPSFFVAVEHFQPLPGALYREGVACVTLKLERARPHAKDTLFAVEAANAYRSLPPGIHEGLLVGEDQAILEGLSSNFFALLDGVLWTEEARALVGITRSLVIEVAEGTLPLRRVGPPLLGMGRSAECFITSVSRGILPVVKVDAERVGEGRPGPLTKELGRRFDALVRRETEVL